MTQSWTEFIIGLIMLISPWLLGFSDISLAKWFNVLIGIILIVINAWTIFIPPVPEITVEKITKNKK